jgi:hypothetical protein
VIIAVILRAANLLLIKKAPTGPASRHHGQETPVLFQSRRNSAVLTPPLHD